MRIDTFTRLTGGKFAGALFAIAALSAMPASAQTFATADSLANGELFTSLPGSTPKVLFSIDLTSVSANDILVVTSEFLLTNDTGSTQTLSAQLILTDSASSLTGTPLDSANVRNVTPNMHHITRVKGAIKQFSSDQGTDHYVNLVVSSSATLSVSVGSGRLQALKISP
jgi:hypothetical protein